MGCPVYRWRDSNPGLGTELGNSSGHAKGKPSVRNTKGESTDGHDGGGSSGSSDEALVTSVERSGCSMTANRAIGTSDRFQRRLSSQDGRAMASRVNREVVLWAAGGEIPPADPAAWNPNPAPAATAEPSFR